MTNKRKTIIQPEVFRNADKIYENIKSNSPQSANKFTIQKRLLSFKYAFNGIAYLYKTQPNLWIHTVVMFVALGLNIVLKISLTEWAIILIVMAMVLVGEIFNTAIELIVDFISPEYNKKAGIIKDVAAGGVLLTVFVAVIVGFLIYLPKIINLF